MPDNGTTDKWTVGILSPGNSGIIKITAKISDNMPEGTTVIKNRSSVQSNQILTIYSNIVQTSIYVAHNSPELSVSKLGRNITRGNSSWSNSVSAEPGDEIEFSIKIDSVGDETVKNVRVRDYLPYKMTYVSGSTSGATTSNVTSGWYNIGNISEGSSETIYFRAKVYSESHFSTGSTSLTNEAKAYADSVNTVSDTARVYINKGSIITETKTMILSKLVRDVSMGQTGFSESIAAKSGETVEFSLQISNTGNATINNIKLWDVLPNNLTYLDGTCFKDNIEVGDGVTSAGLLIGDLPVGQNKTIKFQAVIASEESFGAGTTYLTNYGYVNADGIADISDTASVVITKGQVLGITTIETGPAENFALSLIISLLISIGIYLIIKKEEEIKILLRKLGIKDEKIAKFYACLKLRFVLARIRIGEKF